MIVTRYMEGDATQRIVAHVFDDPTAQMIHPETHGTPSFVSRESPADQWGPPHAMTKEPIEYATWVALIEPDGFTFEERSA